MTKPFEYTDHAGGKLRVLSPQAEFPAALEVDGVAVFLPIGPKLTEFPQAVADDTHVVIPVADLPETPDVAVVTSDQAYAEALLWLAHWRNALAHEAEQGELAKVQELDKLAARLRKAANQPDPKLSTFSRMAREAIAWHEEQEG